MDEPIQISFVNQNGRRIAGTPLSNRMDDSEGFEKAKDHIQKEEREKLAELRKKYGE